MSDETKTDQEKKDQEKEIKEVEEETPVKNNQDGNRTEEPSAIEQANIAAERMEKANAERKVIQKRDEKILAEMRLTGRSSGGSGGGRAETSDEKWAREAKVRYEGTGMDPTPDNTPTTYS